MFAQAVESSLLESLSQYCLLGCCSLAVAVKVRGERDCGDEVVFLNVESIEAGGGGGMSMLQGVDVTFTLRQAE